HDVQQLATRVSDVARPQSVKRDYARLIGHFRHAGKLPFATFGEGDATSSRAPCPGFRRSAAQRGRGDVATALSGSPFPSWPDELPASADGPSGQRDPPGPARDGLRRRG